MKKRMNLVCLVMMLVLAVVLTACSKTKSQEEPAEKEVIVERDRPEDRAAQNHVDKNKKQEATIQETEKGSEESLSEASEMSTEESIEEEHSEDSQEVKKEKQSNKDLENISWEIIDSDSSKEE